MWQLLESKDKMEISKTNSQYSVKENNKKNRNVGTSIGSSLLGGCVPIAFMPLTNSVVNKIQKIGQLSQDKVDILHNAAETALCNTGLKEKGAEAVNAQIILGIGKRRLACAEQQKQRFAENLNPGRDQK